jgi:hypothetical protein
MTTTTITLDFADTIPTRERGIVCPRSERRSPALPLAAAALKLWLLANLSVLTGLWTPPLPASILDGGSATSMPAPFDTASDDAPAPF